MAIITTFQKYPRLKTAINSKKKIENSPNAEVMILRCLENGKTNVKRLKLTFSVVVLLLNRKGTVTEIAWPFDISVFEKLRFRPSTLHHLAGVFKFLHPRGRFRKAPFSVTENAI